MSNEFCGVLGSLLDVANYVEDLRHYEHQEDGVTVSHFDVEQETSKRIHEGYESHDALPWNRNQSDELEERWRQENESQPYVDYDGYLFDEEEDLPDWDEEPDDYETEELWPDEDDFYEEPDEGYCFCGEKLNEDGTCPNSRPSYETP